MCNLIRINLALQRIIQISLHTGEFRGCRVRFTSCDVVAPRRQDVARHYVTSCVTFLEKTIELNKHRKRGADPNLS